MNKLSCDRVLYSVYSYGYSPKSAICIQATPPTIHNQLAGGAIESEDVGYVVGLYCGWVGGESVGLRGGGGRGGCCEGKMFGGGVCVV